MNSFLWLPKEQPLLSLLLLFVATAATFLAIAATNQPLLNDIAPLGIVSLQLAAGPLRAEEILSSWGATERTFAAFNLGLDYLYLVCYTLLLALACSTLARLHRRTGSAWLARLGSGLAWVMPAVALLDGVENFALLHVLQESPQTYWPALATLCAVPKYGTIIVALGYIAVAAVGPTWIAVARFAKGPDRSG